MPLLGMPPLDIGHLRRQVGTLTFARGQDYQRAGHVFERSLDFDQADLRLEGQVRGRRPQPYFCRVWLDEAEAGPNAELLVDLGTCTCPVGVNCKHVVAVALSANAEASRAQPAGAASLWERRLAGAVAGLRAANPPRRLEPVALQFRHAAGRGYWTPGRLEARAARRGRRGAWVAHPDIRLGLQRDQAVRSLSKEQERWFTALARLAGLAGRAGQWLDFGGIDSDQIWELLGAAPQVGIELVGVGASDEVVLADLVETALDVRADGGGLKLIAGLRVSGVEVPCDVQVQAVAVGETGWALEVVEADRRRLVLGPGSGLSRRAEQALRAALPLAVPAGQVDRFWTDYYPALARELPLVSGDNSVALPEIPRPELRLRLVPGEGVSAQLEWVWRYGWGAQAHHFPPDAAPPPAVSGLLALEWPAGGGPPGVFAPDAAAPPFAAAPPGAAAPPAPPAADGAAGDLSRDWAAEGVIMQGVEAIRERHGTFLDPRAQSRQALRGMEVARFAARGLPELRRAEGVVVEGELPPTPEITDQPEITVTAAPSDAGDWFDLGGRVAVGEHQVAFQDLFAALAAGQSHLMTADGSLIPLNRPAFRRLAELIEEARGLSEARGAPRLGRYHASLWGELEDVAGQIEGAEEWRASMARLRQLAAGGVAVEEEPLPGGLAGQLRPYQLAGYNWLVFVWRHRLGGILADDMGLGKTLQVLALIARARQAADGAGGVAASEPFLVVAPSSVVPGWLEEAARFTPGLVVRAATSTRARDGVEMSSLRDGADAVVTTYALFRLDNAEFAAHRWAGLILDEAQFAKNFAAQANQLARALGTPFKLAMTGTPLENSLDELWAIYGIVAPGLLGGRKRFSQLYGNALKQGGQPGAEALARLRRRIKPLLMRRTKELVAPELPERQEQLFHVKLAPKHRKLYDTYLQRERSRMLGLMEDYEANRFAIFRSLTTLRRAALDVSLVDPDIAGVPSSKLDVLMDQLDQVVRAGHRALVFSQFTTYLAKARQRLEAAGVDYAYLDGATTKRADVIGGFKRGTAPVFLISLKAGGFGLNLTEADYVFLLDPWWNPATENQAIDRTHRIGQSRPVMVTRLVAEQTIEDKVMALKQKKQALFDSVLDQDGGFGAGLTAEDVRALVE